MNTLCTAAANVKKTHIQKRVVFLCFHCSVSLCVCLHLLLSLSHSYALIRFLLFLLSFAFTCCISMILFFFDRTTTFVLLSSVIVSINHFVFRLCSLILHLIPRLSDLHLQIRPHLPFCNSNLISSLHPCARIYCI